ncbi:hypothetical protein ACFODL_06280 [Phenylobacterium terrae]|uniref:Uncharacterized protein n=1 Tax=Phenylobacterium terrae TaxID=2665495 RepID=A0ABW4N6E2_9CAUL
MESEGVEPFVPKDDESPEVIAPAERQSRRWPVQYERFHTYPHDDA